MTEERIRKRKKFGFNVKNNFNFHRNVSSTQFRPRWYYGGIIASIRRYGIKAHRNWHLREKITFKFKRFYWIRGEYLND